MVSLILLNGAPGSGKSTLARMYADEHPLALALDVDVVRGMLGCWLDHAGEAGVLARHMAIEMARVNLRAGRDVLVPQFLARPDFLLQLELVSRETGADFIEVVLLNDLTEATGRFVARSRDIKTELHRDAHELQERRGGMDAFPEMYRRMLALVGARPWTVAVVPIEGDLDGTYRDLLAGIDRAARAGA